MCDVEAVADRDTERSARVFTPSQSGLPGNDSLRVVAWGNCVAVLFENKHVSSKADPAGGEILCTLHNQTTIERTTFSESIGTGPTVGWARWIGLLSAPEHLSWVFSEQGGPANRLARRACPRSNEISNKLDVGRRVRAKAAGCETADGFQSIRR